MTTILRRRIIAGVMRQLRLAGLTAMWFLALVTALSSARYFLAPPPKLLLRNEILALARHPTWIAVHIAGGITAISVGLFQFNDRLRNAQPRIHRAIGYLYLSAVSLAGCASLALSPDTPLFAADGLAELTTFDLSPLGLSPAFLGYRASSRFSPDQFFPVRIGFTALAISWLLSGTLAFVRARQRRFDAHREWMIRNYSLTFAAATVRLAAFPLLILTRDPIIAVTCAFWSWMLNLGVAEWVIRRRAISIEPIAQTRPFPERERTPGCPPCPSHSSVPSSRSGVSFPPK